MFDRLRTSGLTSITILVAAALATAGCGGGASEDDIQQAVAAALASQQNSTPAVEPTAEAVSPSAIAVVPSPLPSAAEETVDFVMPNLVSANLQDAQNEMQRLGVFFTISHDMTGNRNQLLDANWQVCEQTPAAGVAVQGLAKDWEAKIDFGAVKLEESCP